ncbi:dna polymerase alpha catalytic subunit [Moniliophthora roreri]|nr:dna polymerase alpha catalytic subunit [Moniliophthora roreri]
MHSTLSAPYSTNPTIYRDKQDSDAFTGTRPCAFAAPQNLVKKLHNKPDRGILGIVALKARRFSLPPFAVAVIAMNVAHFEDKLVGEGTVIVWTDKLEAECSAGQIKLDDSIIFKRLGKNPKDYPKSDSQSHVQVDLKLKARGGNAHAGDIILYVFCLPEREETAKTAQADRARHRDELRKADSDHKIDYEYYLSQQIFPPIECFTMSTSAEEKAFFSMDSQL